MSKTNILPVNMFYDEVAETYNDRMTSSDRNVRKVVSTEFKRYVAHGNILDFGGGTGLDLSWEKDARYTTFFLEPSEKMRAIAKHETGMHTNVVFIEDRLDFKKWSCTCIPFAQKVNGILANFAVLNCIEDIDTLFEKLAMISSKDCYLLATVLDTRFFTLLKNYSAQLAFKSLAGYNIKLQNKHPGIAHYTHLHTPRQYKKAAGPYFHFVAYKPIQSSSFALLILSAK